MSDTPYFTPDQARAQEKALTDQTKYPDDLIDAMRVAVEEDLEDTCQCAFVTRTATNELQDAPGDRDLIIDWPLPTAVIACSIDGQDFDDTALSQLICRKNGTIQRPCGWGRPGSLVTITYEHGMTAPPGRLLRVAIMLTKRFLVDTPVDDRATQITNPDGSSQWLVTAGVGQALYDLPEANAVVRKYDLSGRGV